MTNIHHAIDYVEWPVSDLLVSRTFYEQAFGWQFNDYGPSYAGIKATSGDGEVGGLDATAGTDRAAPLVLLYSDDLDASLDAVTAAGRIVVQRPYAFPGGRRFHFTDPSGTELGVWASA